MLGIGTVKHFPQGTSGNKNDFYRLIVDNPSHILLLAFLFNGNLAITHRIGQLALWVQALNNRLPSPWRGTPARFLLFSFIY